MKQLSRLKQLMVSADLDSPTFKRIQPEVDESNRKSVLMFSLVVLVAMIAMIVVSFIADDLARYRVLYCIGAVPAALIGFLAAHRALNHHTLVLFLMYALLGMLLTFGIVLGTVAGPNEISATYIALLLMVPQMFTDRPVRLYTLIFVSVVTFIVMVIRFKNPITWSSDIANAVVFGCVAAICCTYMMAIKAERFNLVETVRYMAETDQLTGLKNRNCYEMKLQSAAILRAKSIYCVYVDVNGLHELNNAQGHEAGDRMLQYIATVMQNIFGVNDTYRVGGDEYLALGIDREEAELQDMIAKLRQAVDAAGYHVAVGMDFHANAELEINNLVKEAEARMYQDKSAYYRSTGIDRRRNR